jgi:predicted glycosyl hydrolase (DUF1957 family)
MQVDSNHRAEVQLAEDSPELHCCAHYTELVAGHNWFEGRKLLQILLIKTRDEFQIHEITHLHYV